MRRYRIVPYGADLWQVESEDTRIHITFFGKKKEVSYGWDWHQQKFFNTQEEAEQAIRNWIRQDQKTAEELQIAYNRKSQIKPRIYP